MGREFELKYAATPAQQQAVAAALEPLAVTEMATTYYDTPAGELSARKLTLRRRLENGVSICTLKTPAGGFGRGEWDMEADSIQDAAEALCRQSGQTALSELLAHGLTAVCGARFTRRAAVVTLPEAVVEVALDRGVLTGGGRELPLCEIEVELKSGSEAAAEAYARALAGRYGLRPEEKSKFRRAMTLAAGG